MLGILVGGLLGNILVSEHCKAIVVLPQLTAQPRLCGVSVQLVGEIRLRVS